MEEGSAAKQPLELDWNKLFYEGDDDGPPPSVVIVNSKALAGENWKEPAMAAADSADRRPADKHETYEQMADHVLLERINSTRQSIPNLIRTLPDKGAKLRESLKCMEDERDRRKLRRVETIHLEEGDGFEKPTQSISSSIVGGSKDFRRENMASQDQRQSSFGTSFCKKIDGNTDCGAVQAFGKEMSMLGPCKHQKMKNGKEVSQKRRHRDPSLRRSPSKHQRNKHKSNGNEKDRASSIYCQDIREKFSNFYLKMNEAFPVSDSNASRPRKEETIVLVDEEEPQLIGTTQEEEPQLIDTTREEPQLIGTTHGEPQLIDTTPEEPQLIDTTPEEPQLIDTTKEESQLIEREQKAEKPDESMKDVKIYYPSRDDPESVEISYVDFDCLAPEAYLTSTIMNFYMRYLQQHASPTNRVMRDCHFFNTYFYNKLQGAVSDKGSGNNGFFVKFRRWWKGVNIFQKEYILIPINESLHWSLVIICNPEKEERSGPIVLHLDSLGLHCSRTVFQNIKSFLKEEWKYLAREVSPSDLPFAENIWNHLPRRITEKPIAVPQQKNEYDCGLFVLFFMERFIEDAPERLKKKNLEMFGKRWFKPEEASGLRGKIHKLLMEEFKNAQKSSCTLDSSPSSSSDVLEG
ncbi:ubiquitin-like-specific protease 1D isoform X1 [Morus notabilis]|uniref:ubiquitin-like-specific protease 1D isoform X1 n=1 Tax=Morus notabilis TaxID=981085 RepID=UPI000CED14D8|nr:ubiquitin-like-specific protease 1D isoform X1 [Morus notabilis]